MFLFNEDNNPTLPSHLYSPYFIHSHILYHLPCYVVLYCTLHYNVVNLYCTIPMLYCSALYSTALRSTKSYCVALYSIILY